MSVHSFPVIDFSDPELKPGTPKWDAIRAKVREAAEEYGCLVAVFNKVPTELGDDLFKELERVAELPSDAKMRISDSDNPNHKYFGPSAMLPLYEAITFDDPAQFEALEDVVRVLFPEGNRTLSKTVQRVAKQASELEKITKRMMVESFGVEKKYMDELENVTEYLGAILKYDGTEAEADDSELGLHAHANLGMVTVVYQNHVDALEVQTKDGEWVLMKLSSPDSFGVLFGETFHGWSNGIVHPANHRVIMTGDERRYALIVDSGFQAGYCVKVPDELVDEDHSLLFKQFEYGKFVEFAIEASTKGLKSSLIKSYSGASSI